MAETKEVYPNKFSVQVIGEYDKLSASERSYLNDKLSKFVSDFESTLSEGVLVVDITHKKGHYNEGTYRGKPLIYINARFSTDKGLFIANKENWGLNGALHDTLLVLAHQLREQLHKKIGKEKVHTHFSERKMVET